MSPLERVVSLKEISKIRVECAKCHTTAAFPVAGDTHVNIGENCPFCHADWGENVQRVFLDLIKGLERGRDVTRCVVSLELEEAF